MTKTLALFDTLKHNTPLQQYKPDTAFGPLAEVPTMVQDFITQVAGINSDRHLSVEGRAAARQKAANATVEKLEQWHAARRRGLDADVAAQRAALVPAGERPDPRQVERMLSALQQFSPMQVEVLYGSATPAEKVLIEAASALAGRLPAKGADGGVGWATLLSPDVVSESVLARAEAERPKDAQRLRELQAIADAHRTVTAHAIKEVKDAVAG